VSTTSIEDIYPLSAMQQGMLFHTVANPGSGVYCEQMSCLLRGPLDKSVFLQSWQRVIDRHSSLRTAFIWEKVDDPVQVVIRRVQVPCQSYDWEGLTRAEQHDNFATLLQSDRKRGFDLSQAPLMRLALIGLAKNEHRFPWMDGACR
jgi:hypothetical protein